jgi:predicted aspartyl protease
VILIFYSWKKAMPAICNKSLVTLLKIFIISLTFLGALQAMAQEIQLTQIDSGHLIVPVTIGKTKTYFMVDTGSSSSVIDAKFLKKLPNKYKVLSRKTVSGFSPSEQGNEMRQLTLKGVGISNYPAIEISAVEQPLALMLDGLYEQPITGIIGQDVLATMNLSLDLTNTRLITLSEPTVLAKLNKYYTAIPIQMASIGLPYIIAKIKGQDVGLILDSGASEIFFDAEKTKNLAFTNIEYPKNLTSFDQSGNQRQLGLIKNVNVALSNRVLQKKVFVDDFKQLLMQVNQDSSDNIIGLLGFHALASIDGIIDVANQVLYIKTAD